MFNFIVFLYKKYLHDRGHFSEVDEGRGVVDVVLSKRYIIIVIFRTFKLSFNTVVFSVRLNLPYMVKKAG